VCVPERRLGVTRREPGTMNSWEVANGSRWAQVPLSSLFVLSMQMVWLRDWFDTSIGSASTVAWMTSDSQVQDVRTARVETPCRGFSTIAFGR
jgi:hypothetical protein